MPTLENDTLIFRFPEIDDESRSSISFNRTLRVPDTARTYALPAGLGDFPLRHAEDYSAKLPSHVVDRGGVIFPMWQAEAMWLGFENSGPNWSDEGLGGKGLPVAIKIAAGKINAITGDPWRAGLHRQPQDYVISPGQPWLDGFAVDRDVVRQFVSMPLGDGYSVEEQLTGYGEWGGLQISVTPLKASVWERFAFFNLDELRGALRLRDDRGEGRGRGVEMSIGTGGKIHQSICMDSFLPDDWDETATQRVFASLIHAKDWKAVTGEAVHAQPPSPEEYEAAGLPWFDYYGNDRPSVPGSELLARAQTVSTIFGEKTGATMPDNADVLTGKLVPLGPSVGKHRPVRSSGVW